MAQVLRTRIPFEVLSIFTFFIHGVFFLHKQEAFFFFLSLLSSFFVFYLFEPELMMIGMFEDCKGWVVVL